MSFTLPDVLRDIRSTLGRTPTRTAVNNPYEQGPAPMPAAPAAPAGPAPYDPIDPFQLVQYNNAGNSLRTQYGNSSARNTYGQAMLGIQHQRAQDKLGQQFFDYRQQLPGGFAGRGLLQSGLYKHALEQYSQRKLQGQQDLNLDYQSQLGGLQVDQLGTENTLNSGLSSIEAEKQARRAQLAAQLRELG